MFDFAHPYLLFLLFAVPVFWGLYKLARIQRRRKLRRFGNEKIVARLMPDASRYKPAIKITLQLIALAAIVIILARPRMGEREDTRQISNLEIMVAVDVSNSMLAASTDDPKSVSRLRRAKLLMEKLVENLADDKVGLVVFAGEAKTVMPLTTDFYSAKLLLNDLSPKMVRAQGTSIAEALEMCMAGLTKDENTRKVIILITDAEDHEGKAIETATEAAKQGITVDVIGVGTSKGARIPTGANSFMTDSEGNEVITAVDEKAAAELAKAGKGIYLNGADPNALSLLDKNLRSISTSDSGAVKYKVSAEQFPIFAWIALILLVIDILVIERKISWLKNVNFFSKKGQATAKTADAPQPKNKK